MNWRNGMMQYDANADKSFFDSQLLRNWSLMENGVRNMINWENHRPFDQDLQRNASQVNEIDKTAKIVSGLCSLFRENISNKRQSDSRFAVFEEDRKVHSDHRCFERSQRDDVTRYRITEKAKADRSERERVKSLYELDKLHGSPGTLH
jgi:hypothetical protein